MADVFSPIVAKIVISKLFDKGIDTYNQIIKLNKQQDVIDGYLSKVRAVNRVRTLSFTIYDALLDDIYVPIKIKSPSSTIYSINSKTKLPYLRPINIIGRAGQGKSTILKRLFLNEVARGETIPFFFELKNFVKPNLEENLSTELKKWGINISNDDILNLLSRNEVSLYLDAFDEIPTENLENVENQIFTLEASFKCKIFITSRPNTSICKQKGIDNFITCDLSEEQVNDILKILCKNEDEKNRLVSALNSKPYVKGLLVSPILVVLLQLAYAHSNAIPNSLADFYNKIFVTLYENHDSLKTNVNRKLQAGLSFDDAERVFQAFCYFGLKNDTYSFSKNEALETMKQALDVTEFDNIKASDYFNDIVTVTNIMQEDGYDNFVFFHRSLQEFYTYRFIKTFFDENEKYNFFTKFKLPESYILRHQFSLVLDFFKEDKEQVDIHKILYEPTLKYILGKDYSGDNFIRVLKDTELTLHYYKSEDNNDCHGESYSVRIMNNNMLFMDEVTHDVFINYIFTTDTHNKRSLRYESCAKFAKIIDNETLQLSGLELFTHFFSDKINEARVIYLNSCEKLESMYKTSFNKINNRNKTSRYLLDDLI
ncbi:NACHT domain-containing NTPase [Vibrio navarrensis]